jgi:uncharacterized protein YkwD
MRVDRCALAVVAALALPAASAAQDVRGRCPDGREWTSRPADVVHMFGVLNQVRASKGRDPLVRHAVLDKMAHTTSVDMACRDYVAHRAPGAKTLEDKLNYVAGGDVPDWERLSEVIGTSLTAERQVDRWLDSRSHRRAVLSKDLDRVGVGLVYIAQGSRYTTYWTVEFMRERDTR